MERASFYFYILRKIICTFYVYEICNILKENLIICNKYYQTKIITLLVLIVCRISERVIVYIYNTFDLLRIFYKKNILPKEMACTILLNTLFI